MFYFCMLDQTSFSFPAQEPPEQEDIVLLDASFGTISLDNKEIPAEMSYVPSTAKVQRHKPALPASLDMNSPRYAFLCGLFWGFINTVPMYNSNYTYCAVL